MLTHARFDAPWYRARSSMYSTACWSFIAIVLLGCLSQVYRPWLHAIEFMAVAALITFALSFTLGLGTSLAGQAAISIQRRRTLAATLERPGRALLLIKPSWTQLAVAFFRFGTSAMFQFAGAALLWISAPRVGGLDVLGGASMAVGLAYLLAGLSSVSEYAHMRDAWREAKWRGGTVSNAGLARPVAGCAILCKGDAGARP